VAILFFGGVWGLWGVFFAIPLATVIQAVLQAWPRPGAADQPPDLPADAGQPGG
jgi:putative permease